jgi:phospholipid-binding lipoprotein MlaA
MMISNQALAPKRRKASRCFNVLLLSATAALSGCASMRADLTDTISPDDPIEPVNRVVYKFNDALDKYFLQPVAQSYTDVIPLPVRECVRNIFNNLEDIPGAFNNALQGRLTRAGSDAARLAVNSTAGILGCFDVASEMGLDKHRGDFGQTLGVWGVPAGPYLMLPFFGPSTVRDAVGRFTVDIKTNAIGYIDHIPTRNETYALDVIDQRASLLDGRNFLQDAALDPYVFLREAYLGRRRSRIGDGAFNGRVKPEEYATVSTVPDSGLAAPEPVAASSEAGQDNATGPDAVRNEAGQGEATGPVAARSEADQDDVPGTVAVRSEAVEDEAGSSK